MSSNRLFKEFTFSEIQNPNYRITTKSPEIKFKISPTHSCPTIPLANFNKTMKIGLISDILSITKLNNSPMQTKIITKKQVPIKIKEKMCDSNIFNEIPTLNYIKEVARIEKPDNDHYRNIEISRPDFKFADINPIYSDCMEDLDKKCLFFNTKIQKQFKKKIDKQIYENVPYNNKQMKVKSKCLKPLKNKNLQKIKQVIFKEKAKEISQTPYNHNQEKNRKYFNILYIKDTLSNQKNIDKFTTFLILHLDPKTQDDWSFFNKISDNCVIILIIPENCSFSQDLLFFDAVFKENFSKLSRCPLIIDYWEIMSELLSFKINEVKNLIIISEIFSNATFSKNINIESFDLVFPKEMKGLKLNINLIYFENEFKSSNIVIQMINDLINGKHFLNESIIQLNIDKIHKIFKVNETKEKHLEQWHDLFKLLKKKPKIAEMKDSCLFQELEFFQKNVSKTRKKILKKQSEVPFEAYKIVSNDLIKRNLQYFVKENGNYYEQSHENEIIVKKLSNITASCQMEIKKSGHKKPIFKYLKAYLIQN